jgi:hypothetical protein
MMDEEPPRYWSLTGGTAYGENPLDSQTLVDTKQCEEPESMSAHKWELNPAATCCTNESDECNRNINEGCMLFTQPCGWAE